MGVKGQSSLKWCKGFALAPPEQECFVFKVVKKPSKKVRNKSQGVKVNNIPSENLNAYDDIQGVESAESSDGDVATQWSLISERSRNAEHEQVHLSAKSRSKGLSRRGESP